MKIYSVLSILVFSLLSLNSFGKIFTDLDEIFDHLKGEGFSGVIHAEKNGKVIFSKAMGVKKNKEPKEPIKLSHRSFIGSVTKQMTAVAILQLEQKGLLSVKDKVSIYIKDFPNAEKMTVENLVHHTAGLWNYTQMIDFSQDKNYELDDLIDLFKNKPLDFEPGTKHQYSNSGYILLAKIIEVVSGQRFADYLREHLFIPLKMKNTGLIERIDQMKGALSGHQWDKDYKLKYIGYKPNLTWAHAAGGVYSTAEDMILWGRGIRSGKVISKKTYNQMISRCVSGGTSKYCYAAINDTWSGQNVIWHNGGFPGFNAVSVYVPSLDLDLVILRNYLGGSSSVAQAHWLFSWLVNKSADIPVIDELDVEPQDLQRYTGTYSKNIEGFGKLEFFIHIKNEKLYIRIIKNGHFQEDWRLIPVETLGKFVLKVADAQMTYSEDLKQVRFIQSGIKEPIFLNKE